MSEGKYTEEEKKAFVVEGMKYEIKGLYALMETYKAEKSQLVEALKPLCDEREEPPFSLNQIADILRTSRVHRELGLAKVLDKYSEQARAAVKAAGEEIS